MSRYKGCRFRTQSALSQTHRLEACLNRLSHFLLAEIAFRANQNQGILAWYNHFFQEFFFFFLTMADEFLSLEILRDELVEVCHFIQYRLVGLQGLLDSRY